MSPQATCYLQDTGWVGLTNVWDNRWDFLYRGLALHKFCITRKHRIVWVYMYDLSKI